MILSGQFCCEPMTSLKIFFIHLKKPNAYMTGEKERVIIDSVSKKKESRESHLTRNLLLICLAKGMKLFYEMSISSKEK